jgi:hypothetical protein
MATTAFDVVLKELSERRDAITQALAGGSAKDFAEYKQMCGEIRGLSIAHSIITDLVRQMEYSDNE